MKYSNETDFNAANKFGKGTRSKFRVPFSIHYYILFKRYKCAENQLLLPFDSTSLHSTSKVLI